MKGVVVSHNALREFVRSALDGGHLGDLTVPEEEPVNVNPVVDPSAYETDPINPDFVPKTQQELDVTFRNMVKGIPNERVPKLYDAIKGVIDDIENKAETQQAEDEMKKIADSNKPVTEETIRRSIRKTLAEIGLRSDMSYSGIEPDMSGIEDDDDDDDEPKKGRAYKSTAIGNMNDVGGSSFEEIAQELGFSVAGAKQAVDKALLKAQWIGKMQLEDPDEVEILVLTAMNDYIKLLSKSGELTAADVQLMKDHPDIVRDLDGFREFLHTHIKRARKSDQQLEDPLGEADGDSETLKMDVGQPTPPVKKTHTESVGRRAQCRLCKESVGVVKTTDKVVIKEHKGPDGHLCLGSRERVRLIKRS